MASEHHTTVKEPLIHITKNAAMPFWKGLLIRATAVVAAFLFCSLLAALFIGANPGEFIRAFIEGNFGGGAWSLAKIRIWELIKGTAILLIISLAVTPAFRMRFWNIGAEGQVLISALASAAVVYYGKGIKQEWLLLVLMLIAAVAAGIIWAAIPAIFKALWNANETLFTLMMNYVGLQLVAYYVIIWEVPKGSGKIGIINQATEAGWLPQIGSYKYLLNILVVAIITVLMYIYMNYTKQGYEIAVVGESENTARYVGINVGKVIVRTLILSGAICGLTGFLLVAGTNHTVTTSLAGGRGFTAVMIAWMGKFNPIAMIFASFLIAFLEQGAGEISTMYSLNKSFSDILTGIIIFFIIGSEFFINYKLTFNKTGEKEAK